MRCDVNWQLSWGVFTEGQADHHIFSQNFLEATARNCLSITLSFVDNSHRHLGHCHTVTLVHWNWHCKGEVQAMLYCPHLCLSCSPLTSGWAESGTCLTWPKMQFVVAVAGSTVFSVIHSGDLHKGWVKRKGQTWGKEWGWPPFGGDHTAIVLLFQHFVLGRTYIDM